MAYRGIYFHNFVVDSGMAVGLQMVASADRMGDLSQDCFSGDVRERLASLGMKVTGDEAKKWKAVNRDSLEDISGKLVEADEDTGKVAFLDKTGEKKEVDLGPHRVVLIRKDDRDHY